MSLLNEYSANTIKNKGFILHRDKKRFLKNATVYVCNPIQSDVTKGLNLTIQIMIQNCRGYPVF